MKMKGPKGKMCVGIPGFSWKVCDHSCHKEILFFFFPFPFSFFFISLCLLGLFFAFLLKFVLLRGGYKGGMLGGGEIDGIRICDVKATKIKKS